VRVLLFTGKGGVGKTTTAAATAVRAARAGVKTLVLSTDPAHSLADALGRAVDGRDGLEGSDGTDGGPVEVEPGLSAQQIDTRARARRWWGEVQDYLLDVLESVGVDPVAAEELTLLPGAEEVLALLELRDQVEHGPWDLVVVDCAPTAETLRLLALPEALRWAMERVFPAGRLLVRSARPLLGRTIGVPMPHDSVFGAVQRLHDALGEVQAMLTAPQTSVRLVLTPEAVVVAEARRTFTSLSLYGYRVDGVVANRVFPAGGDEWRTAWAGRQAELLGEIAASCAPVPVRQAAYRATEPVGPDQLAALAEDLYAGGPEPWLDTDRPEPLRVERTGDEFILVLDLPLTRACDVDLERRGDDLWLLVAGHRRVVALPSALRRCIVVGATVKDGSLRVRFEPDPALWRSL
jgi:arsenite/tail-anchored protein-transporting ATPase